MKKVYNFLVLLIAKFLVLRYGVRPKIQFLSDSQKESFKSSGLQFFVPMTFAGENMDVMGETEKLTIYRYYRFLELDYSFKIEDSIKEWLGQFSKTVKTWFVRIKAWFNKGFKFLGSLAFTNILLLILILILLLKY